MLTVGNSTAVAEDLLRNGGLSCPGCGGRLGGWGHAVPRRVFTAERVPVSVRPRRAQCGSCRATHVLLPAWVLARRCDGTAVIGDMLARAARGQGFRSIAAASGVPEDTVRGLCVPKTSSTSCGQAIFVDQATGACLFSDAVLAEVDWLG